MGCRIAKPGEYDDEQVTPCEYCKRISLYLGYSFCQVCIGSASMMAFAYSIKTNDYHGAFCTIGWQFLVAEGILIMVYTWFNPLEFPHRRTAHMFLQILGLMFAIAGSVLIIFIVIHFNQGFKLHGALGIAAFIMTLVTALAGPIAALKYHSTKIIHAIFGLPTFIVATATFITGTATDRFIKFVGSPIVIISMMLCIYCSVFIVVNMIVKIVERIKLNKRRPPAPSCGGFLSASSSKVKK